MLAEYSNPWAKHGTNIIRDGQIGIRSDENFVAVAIAVIEFLSGSQWAAGRQ